MHTVDPDLARVLALPRSEPPTPEMIEYLSAHLRKRERNAEGERNMLRPQQVECLRALWEQRGVFAQMPVGAGKTLVTLTAPVLLQSQAPVLLLPAALREKTKRDFAEYFKDWHVRLPTLRSYEEMARVDREGELELLAPDLLLADECDATRRLRNAVTKRIERYRRAHPECIYAPMSGTLVTEHLLDYSHNLVWALRTGAPVPLMPAAREKWADAIDKECSTLTRETPPPIPGGFHEHMRRTPGVVCGQGVECDASIRISLWTPELPPALSQLIETTAASGLRPDGEQLNEFEMPDCLCRLALGHYVVWDPMPPLWWLQPRRAWWGYVRAVLDEHLDAFDTADQIVQALDNERRVQPPAAHEARALLAAWRAVSDQFEPNPVPVWIDDQPIREIAARVQGKGVLVWTPHVAVGERLEAYGVPYYGAGLDPEQAPPGKTIAVSVQAHHRGKNLQAWHRNLIVKPAAKQHIHEQLIGRTHRSKQKADTIFVEYLNSIDYHGETLARVLTQARAVTRAGGSPQKLAIADWT